jgi:hypothetical protein
MVEFVGRMELRNNVDPRDAPIKSTRVEFVLRMALRSRDAATKDVTMVPSKEEFASRMERRWRRSSAVLWDVPIKLRREECVSHMERSVNDAVLWDVPIKLRREEFVSRMAQKWS